MIPGTVLAPGTRYGIFLVPKGTPGRKLFESRVQFSAQNSKVMFCRVCGFRVRVWESYRTCRTFGYEYGSVTGLTEVPGIVARRVQNSRKFRAGTKNAVPVPRVLWQGRTELTEVPGTGMNVLQNSTKFRVRV